MFIHVPKNAGTSIRNSFNINGYDKKVVSRRYPHSTCSEIKKYIGDDTWNEYYKFSFVRHPFDRLVSFYHFHKSNQYKHKVGRERAYTQKDFNSVCNQIGIPSYELPHYNQSQHEHWSTFWDDELNKYILDKYQRDFQNFAYSINVVRNGV